MIPVVDLSRRLGRLEAAYVESVRRVMRSGTLLLGPELDAFEREAAALLGGMDVVGVSSGAGAIELALAALGIGPGDEVIVPAFTAVPTVSAVCAVGATPVPVDVDVDTALIDVDRALDAVTGAHAGDRSGPPVRSAGRPVAAERGPAADRRGCRPGPRRAHRPGRHGR